MLLYLKLGIAAAGAAALIGVYLWIAAAFSERDDLRTAVGRLAKVASDNAQVALDAAHQREANIAARKDLGEFTLTINKRVLNVREIIANAPDTDRCRGVAADAALDFLRQLPASP